MRTLEEVLKSHHYHTPSPDTQVKITIIRKACKSLAKLIFETCPPHPDTTVALRDLETARMRAIACLAFYSPDSVMIDDRDEPTGASGQLPLTFENKGCRTTCDMSDKDDACCQHESLAESILNSEDEAEKEMEIERVIDKHL